MTRVFGSEDLDDRDWYDPDPYRHDVPDGEASAVRSWARTLAAIDGDAGVALYGHDDLHDEQWAYWDDFTEEPS